MKLGIAYVSEDRRQLGLVLPMAIFANITLPVLRRYLDRLGLVRTRLERLTADDFRTRLAIRAPSVDLEVGKLSGGNQQKVMLSKWLNTNPSVLILDEPTRGVDVSSKAEVHAIVGATRGGGDRRHRDLVGSARGAGSQRPRAGHERGAADGDSLSSRSRSGDRHDCGDGAEIGGTIDGRSPMNWLQAPGSARSRFAS